MAGLLQSYDSEHASAVRVPQRLPTHVEIIDAVGAQPVTHLPEISDAGGSKCNGMAIEWRTTISTCARQSTTPVPFLREIYLRYVLVCQRNTVVARGDVTSRTRSGSLALTPHRHSLRTQQLTLDTDACCAVQTCRAVARVNLPTGRLMLCWVQRCRVEALAHPLPGRRLQAHRRHRLVSRCAQGPVRGQLERAWHRLHWSLHASVHRKRRSLHRYWKQRSLHRSRQRNLRRYLLASGEGRSVGLLRSWRRRQNDPELTAIRGGRPVILPHRSASRHRLRCRHSHCTRIPSNPCRP